MTLWLLAVTPTVLPCLHEGADHPRACVGLASTRRPLDGEQSAFDRARHPEGGIEAGLAVMLNLLAANAGRHAHEEVARGLKRPFTLHSMIGNPFSNANQRVRENIRIDHRMREDRFRVNICAVAPLLDVDPALLDRNCRRRRLALRHRDCASLRRRASRFPGAGSCNGEWAPWLCRRSRPQK